MKVCAPGKFILSGEHAVVYGKPALALAINRHAMATVTEAVASQIIFELPDLADERTLPVEALCRLKEQIQANYQRFVRGKGTIQQVLQKPAELAQFALSVVVEALAISLAQGIKVHLQSTIPIGCGMGSSAATVLSIISAAANYRCVPLSQETLFQLALMAENKQHGYSSGFDLQVSLRGGCLYMHEQAIEERPLPFFPLYLVHTGSPQTTTGQCVAKARPYFKTSRIGDDFAAVTQAMDGALRQQSLENVYETVRHNHQLLVEIGVVPEKVQRFIREVQVAGGAAKICGAGAVAGEQAGAVWVVTENAGTMSALCTRYDYTLLPIAAEARGIHVV